MIINWSNNISKLYIYFLIYNIKNFIYNLKYKKFLIKKYKHLKKI
jgi:hypothetical protein